MPHKLSKLSRQIAESTSRFNEVTAVPGGAKTSTGAARVAHLLETDSSAIVCVVSATNATTAHFEQRLREAGIEVASNSSKGQSSEGSRVIVSTLHALMWKLIQRHFHLLGLARCPTVIDAQHRDKLLKQMNEAPVRPGKSGPRVEGKSVSRLQRRAPGGGCRSDEAAAKNYQNLKRTSNMVDFDDMMQLGLQLVTNLTAEQLGIDHLIVDEWQDCSALQSQVVGIIASRVRSTLVLGDPLQMIYGFAGGRYVPLKCVLRDAGVRKKVARFELSRSYRCTAEIADLAMAVAAPLKPPTIRTKKSGKRPELIEENDSRALAVRVAKRVKKLLDEGVGPSQIALLGRVRSALHPVAQELAARHVPTLLAGSANHYQAVLDVLWLADKIEDLRTYGLGLETAPGRRRAQMSSALQAEIREQLALDQPADRTPEIASAAGKRSGAGSGIFRPTDKRWEEFFDKLLRMKGGRTLEGLYGSCLRAYQWLRGGINSDKVLRNALNAWVPRCRQYESAARMSLHVLKAASATEVTCSTIHAAKGLEWDHVFVLGVTEGVLPDRRAVSREQLEEERRSLYVAITRARKRLWLCHSPIKVSGVRRECKARSSLLTPRAVQKSLNSRGR